jgi:hypothetical protein
MCFRDPIAQRMLVAYRDISRCNGQQVRGRSGVVGVAILRLASDTAAQSANRA